MTTAAKALVLILALVALLGAVYKIEALWQGAITDARTEGVTAGRTAALKEVADRDNEKLIAANKKILELTAKVQELQAQLSKTLGQIDANYQRGLADGKARTDRFIADVRSGRVVLRDPGQGGAWCTGGGVGVGTATSASAAGSDGQAGARLSAEASEFLLALTGEADDVTRQLAACQSVVEADRAAINKP